MAGRTAFYIYRLQRRDLIALAAIVLLVAYVIVGYATDGIYWQYYPLVSWELTSAYSISIFAAYLGCACCRFSSISGRISNGNL